MNLSILNFRFSFIFQRFLSTLKDVRRKSIDKRRFSNSFDSEQSTSKIYSMKDIKERLSDKTDLKELISSEEIDIIFEEVQKELGWIQDQEIDLYDAEIQAVVENLTTYCLICDQTSDKEICQSCGNEHFTESL